MLIDGLIGCDCSKRLVGWSVEFVDVVRLMLADALSFQI